MRNTKSALIWVVEILNKRQIPFQVTGGFAAKIYGSKRKLADIDIDIPENRFNELLNDVHSYIKFGPSQYKDSDWDLKLLTLNYKNQDIDLCGAYKVKIYNKLSKKWVILKSNFKKSIVKTMYGISIPVIPKNELISYKNKVLRGVDKIDIRYLKRKDV